MLKVDVVGVVAVLLLVKESVELVPHGTQRESVAGLGKYGSSVVKELDGWIESDQEPFV